MRNIGIEYPARGEMRFCDVGELLSVVFDWTGG
jgi:hypothetical protein